MSSNGNNQPNGQQTQNNGQQSNQPLQNPFDSAELVNNLRNGAVTLQMFGVGYRFTCEQLEQQVERLFQESMGFPELNHVLIWPVINRGGVTCDIKTIFYFDTTCKGSSITRNGNLGDGVKTILDYAPIKGINGEFSVSNGFKETFTSIAVLDENGNIPIKSTSDRRIACIEIDFMTLMGMCLGIKPDDSYNFKVMTVDAGNNRNNGYENALITVFKYIDNTSRYSRNKGNGNHVDYRSIDRAFIRASNPDGDGGRNW